MMMQEETVGIWKRGMSEAGYAPPTVTSVITEWINYKNMRLNSPS